MAATVVPSVMVNLKALDKNNYKHWSFRVKTYLVAEDLWDVVEDTNDPPKLEDGKAIFMAWRKNNATALHAITISCGEDAESAIGDIEMAKDAWNTLAEKFKPPEIIETQDFNSEVDSGSDDGNADSKIDAIEAYDHETYASFFNKVATAMEDGKWEDVKEFMKQHPEAVRAKHGLWGLTVFHKVVRYQDVRGVKELLPFMRKKDWGILDNEGRTAFSLVIEEGHTDDAIEILKCIVEKNKKLLLRVVHPSAKTVPLVYALSLDKPKMARYLYSVTPLEKLKSRDAAELVSTGLRLKHLDISLDLLRSFPNLTIAKDHSGQSPLNELASTRARLFSNVSKLGMRKRLIYRCMPTPTPTPITREVSIDVQNEEKDQGNRKHHIGRVTCSFRRLVVNLRRLFGIDDIYEMKSLNVQAIEILKCMCAVLKEDNYKNMQHKVVVKALFQAVERGHAQFIAKIIWDNWLNPINWFLTVTNEHDKTVFQLAAEHRQWEIFALITCFDTKERQEIIGRKDKSGNNMLHVLGKLTPVAKIAHIRGAALQMQNELQWFKGVEGLANPKDLNCINSEGRTPREEFTMNHKDLVKEGASSMKETATSSSALVAALIITIMFAAAVTVPGGIDGDTGIPIYLHTKAFRTFIVADVISLCSATTSVMIFLGILTSRFAEQDFLTSLPTKLILGFLTLFLSIGAMMIAFSSAIFIMLPETSSIVIPSIVLATAPIASFLRMQFPFLLDIIISTYGFQIRVYLTRIRLLRWAHSI